MTRRRWTRALLQAAVVALALFALPAAKAMASTQQISIIEDENRPFANPVDTFARARLLGADAMRVSVHWDLIAPAPNARKMPRGFNPSDPASYPARNWGLWDAVVSYAQQAGIKIDFDLMGGAPRWALGPGRPRGSTNDNREPSPAAFGAFVHAIATRYSGTYVPPGQ